MHRIIDNAFLWTEISYSYNPGAPQKRMNPTLQCSLRLYAYDVLYGCMHKALIDKWYHSGLVCRPKIGTTEEETGTEVDRFILNEKQLA